MGAVLGVDGCKGGWVGVLWRRDAVEVLVALDLGSLVAQAGDVDAVAVDIPIGLVDGTDRGPEALARARLPGRASTVFNAPALAALHAPSYEVANAMNRTSVGKGLSRQAYSLLPKIVDAHDYVSAGPAPPVIEAHPELCFATMNGSVVREPKKTTAGVAIRRRLLLDVGIDVPTRRVLGAATDDVLDAAAVAWTARRFADGAADRLPEEPRHVLRPAIWA
ncbi:DUF429 domain-containing protein [Aeromicrobium sp. UC242_57]|uniref:DUF429 domain-containing protein n=1 Tax=Aeromicrobium sp. UC242_57 TaxID=3374624 RepID=UPI0037895422